MNLIDYVLLFRRHWVLVVGLPVLVALISLGFELTRPPQYQVAVRAIVTRGVADEQSTAGMTWAREDTVAQDLPTIVNGSEFASDVVAALEAQGIHESVGAIQAALTASNDGKIVSIAATASTATEAEAIANAAVAALHANGLRYWGDPTWSPARPGVNFGPLDGPGAAMAVPTRRQIVVDSVLRTLAALFVACGLAVTLDALNKRTLAGRAVASH